VALTPVRNPGGGQRYLMLLAGEGGQEIRLYRSRSTDGTDDGPTDLTAPTVSWVEFEAFTGDDLGTGWPCCDSQSPQMLNFVREGSLDGDLYLIGSYNPTSVLGIGGGRDYFLLHRVNVDAYGNPGHPLLTRIETLHVTTNSIAGDTAHFTGSTGVYVSPSGELILYANEHEEQGPFGIDPISGEAHRSVRAGEWRHREMVRPGSPTLQPSVEAPGSYAVNEGSSVTVSATGRQATTRAWLQLFANRNLGLTDDDFNSELVFDFDDRSSEDYDNLPANVPFFNDEASAWRWFAPQGCTLEADQHSIDDGNFPGLYKQLPGDGTVHSASNLSLVLADNGAGSMDDMISAVRFFCDDYYNATIGVSWDLDRNGSFETVGGSAVVSAAGLDGPGNLSVPVRAQHPTDTTALGQSAPQSVQVVVRNVAPAITTFGLFNSAGGQIGSDVPFALVGVSVVARGTFTDPGTPDHQTAGLNWGDGTLNDSGVFNRFSDAFGGRVGEVEHAHVYAAASNYTVVLAVTDDDGGGTSASTALTVVTPEQAIGSVIASLDQLIANTPGSKSKLRKALESARRALSGGNTGSSNDGALDKLRDGDRDAARAKVLEAISDLQDAAGADVAPLIAILQQVAQALT